MQEGIDFSKYDEKPTKTILTQKKLYQLNMQKTYIQNFSIRKNEIETVDTYFQLGFQKNEYEFYDIMDTSKIIEV